MGTIVTPPNTCREIIERAGGDSSLADYDSTTQTLTAPGVSNAALATAQAEIAGRTAAATTNDKRKKAAEKAEEALQRHNDAVLAGDATYQAELVAIAAAATLADLDAV